MTTSIKLIVGLGNPGPEHALDRHNAGYWFVDALAQRCETRFTVERKFQGEAARASIGRHDVRLLKPTTYMNNSGQAVQAMSAFFKIEPGEILVVHDELDLPAGTARLKRGGGHGGHNGLRSVIAHLGRDFLRLRLGVGHPGQREAVIGHVLQRASRTDEERIVEAMVKGLDVLPLILGGQEQRAMHRLHSKPKASEDADDGAGNGKAKKADAPARKGDSPRTADARPEADGPDADDPRDGKN